MENHFNGTGQRTAVVVGTVSREQLLATPYQSIHSTKKRAKKVSRCLLYHQKPSDPTGAALPEESF